MHNYYNPQRVLVSMVILMFRSQWRGGAWLKLGGWSLSAGEVVENLDVSWVSCLARRLEMTWNWAGPLG